MDFFYYSNSKHMKLHKVAIRQVSPEMGSTSACSPETYKSLLK